MRTIPRAAATLLVVLCLAAPNLQAADKDAPQWRAFWVDAFNAGIKTPEQVDQLVNDVKAMHANTLIVQVRKRGDAYFRKTIDPFAEDRAVPEDFDPLADLLKKAHKEGLQVHAWINPLLIWKPNDAPPKSAQHVYNLHGPRKEGRDNWLTCDDKGQTRFATGYFLDPGHPDVPAYLERVVVDLVKNYDVDGIHLDYIRFPETEAGEQGGYGVGYNAQSVERFNRLHRLEGLPKRNDAAWKDWRRQQVTQLVRRLRVAVLDVKPQVLFSAALIPWGDGPADEAAWERSAAYLRVFQDWHAWRKEGLLDLIVPMNYDRAANKQQKGYFTRWVAFEKTYRYRSQVVVGLGAYLNSVADTHGQLQEALAGSDKMPAADGVCFYSYAAFKNAAGDRPTLKDLKRMLVEGEKERPAPFARPADLPVVARVAKPTEGAVAGIVVDSEARPRDGHPVRIEPAEGPAIALRTDGNGFFAVVFLKPGRCRVTIGEGDGAKTETVDVAAGKILWIGKKAEK